MPRSASPCTGANRRGATGGPNQVARTLGGVTLPANWTSIVGALEGVLAAVGKLPVAPAGLTDAQYLMGVTGHAFTITVDAMVTAAGPDSFRPHQQFPLWEQLRVWFRHLYCHGSAADLAGARAEARERVVACVDRGCPAIFYGVAGTAGFGLITGYEGDGQRLLGLSPQDRHAPQWFDLSAVPAAPWSKLEVLTLVSHEPGAADPRRAALAALRFAVDHGWAPPSRDGWEYYGLKAYGAWRTSLMMPQHPPEAARGHAYTAEVTWHARRDAAAFCRYLASAFLLEPAAAAAEAYDQVVAALGEIRVLIPFPHGADLADRDLRRQAQEWVLRAQRAEERALGHLENAIRQLKF